MAIISYERISETLVSLITLAITTSTHQFQSYSAAFGGGTVSASSTKA